MKGKDQMRKILSIFIVLLVLLPAGLLFAEEQAAAPASTAATQSASAPEAVAPASPAIDTGDTAWMIVATALVMMMTLPGLALFYGGLSKRKDTLNTMAMSFVAFCIVSVLWVLYGYTLAFSGDLKGVIGNGAKLFLSGVGVNSVADAAKTIPEYIFIAYQLTFAAITVALASGAYIERMKFSAWILFSLLWLTFV
jgi:Amt family ammonium transporter